MDDNEEDDFLVDDLDLTEEAWAELEQYAIQATQQQHASISGAHPISRSYGERGHSVYEPAAQTPTGTQLPKPGPNHQYEQPMAGPLRQRHDDSYNNVAGAPSRGKQLGEPALQKSYGQMTQREQWRQRRYGGVDPPTGHQQSHPQIHQQTSIPEVQHGYGFNTFNPEPESEDVMLLDRSTTLASGTTPIETHREEALRAQIAGLIRDREGLSNELEAARNSILTQKGEIAIVRANQSKDSQNYADQLAALRRSMHEDAANSKTSIEATNRQTEKAANDNQFLRRELQEERERIKMLRSNLRDKETILAKGAAGASTPQRNRQLPLRDGFDEDDVVMMSPSRAGRHSKPSTPTKAGKKKRKVPHASPGPALDLTESFNVPIIDPTKSKIEAEEKEREVLNRRVNARSQQSLQFMQRILNHRLSPSRSRILEVFSAFSFDSESSESFTSIVLQDTASLSGETLPIGFTKIIVGLWDRALKERYFKPVSSLIAVVQYIMAWETLIINSSEIIQKLVPVLVSSTEINGAIRFKNSPVAHQNFGKFKQTPKSELNSDVDGTGTLDMLYTIACMCIRKPKLIQDIWRTMHSDFILMMLNVAQPITDLTLTLSLLATSILPDTFGPIMANDADQARVETYLVNRVGYLLWETPRVDEDQPPPTRHAIYQLRSEALSLLTQLAFTSSPHPHDSPKHHGSLLLVSEPTFIARLVRFIYDTVDALYSPQPITPSTHPALHALLSSLIDRSVFLLHHLLKTHEIDVREKLGAVNGGAQKHRVVLTRLAFSEGTYLESGIKEETFLLARTMLEDVVAPNETDDLLQVFPSALKRFGLGDFEDDDDDDEDQEQGQEQEIDEEMEG